MPNNRTILAVFYRVVKTPLVPYWCHDDFGTLIYCHALGGVPPTPRVLADESIHSELPEIAERPRIIVYVIEYGVGLDLPGRSFGYVGKGRYLRLHMIHSII